MSRAGYMFVVLAVGCSSREENLSDDISEIAIAHSDSEGGLSLAYASTEKADRLPEVLSGQAPKDFRWVAVRIDKNLLGSVRSSEGLHIQMSSNPGISFSQVYQGVCNPALEDFSTCWLFESFASGDVGVSGTAFVRIGATDAHGVFDVSWEGITDRFGDPPQWHRHGTSTGYNGQLIPEAQ